MAGIRKDKEGKVTYHGFAEKWKTGVSIDWQKDAERTVGGIRIHLEWQDHQYADDRLWGIWLKTWWTVFQNWHRTDKAKFIGVEIFKEAVGTVGGFGGVWLGEKLGLSQDQSMLLGMTTSIVSSKGADWVDNNLDNLVLAGKYTFNNSGKCNCSFVKIEGFDACVTPETYCKSFIENTNNSFTN